LEAANQRLGAMVELGQLLTREHNLTRLLEVFCKRVRDLIGATYAAVGILAEDGQSLRHFFMAGSDAGGAARMGVPSLRTPLLETLLAKKHALHLRHPNLGLQTAVLSPEQTPPESFLGVRIQSSNQVHGLLYLVDKLGAEEFTASDEQVTVTLASQLAVAYENACLLAQTRQSVQRLAALRAIDLAILSSFDLRATLNVLLDQTTTQLGIDAADVLLLDPRTQTLECAAVRGFRSTMLDGRRLRLDEGRALHTMLEHGHICISNLTDQAFIRRPLLAEEKFVAYHAAPLIANQQFIGVLETFQRSPLHPDAAWLESLDAFAGQAAIAVNSAELFQNLQRSNAELSLAYDATLEGWVHALDLRDKETEGHTQRVTEATLHLARAAGLNRDELVHLRRGALLHDIGKIGIPDQILLKPGPLSSEEWEIMRRHPLYAYEWLSPITYLHKALDIPYCHHEKWDGTGYPRGLKNQQIPLAARVFAIVDVWDALSSDRPYRAAWSEEEVCKHIQTESEKHFDPAIVKTFLSLDRSGWREPAAANRDALSARSKGLASSMCAPVSMAMTP
jgi:HD-GYP domain-containing protein (c-di-GMP phosphodiesterase class II)